MEFDGFVAADFDAFARERWSSHAFNRQRLEAKLKLAALGKTLLSGLPGFSKLDQGVTDERPSVFNEHQVRFLRWFALRSAEERTWLDKYLPTAAEGLAAAGSGSDYRRHLQLAVQLEAEGLRAGLYLPLEAAADRRQCQTLLAKPEGERKLVELMARLPTGAGFFGAGGEPWRASGSEGGAALPPETKGAEEWWLGVRLGVESVSQMGGTLLGKLGETLAALLPCYQLLAWSREGDLIGLTRMEKQRQLEAAQQVQVGDSIRIVAGLASGKTAVVEDLDRRGTVKVRLGNVLLSLRVDEIEKRQN